MRSYENPIVPCHDTEDGFGIIELVKSMCVTARVFSGFRHRGTFRRT